jgi:hypothetical protein
MSGAERTDPARRESAAGVLLIGGALLVLAALVAWLASGARGAVPFDGEELLAELLAGERPLGLTLVEGGVLPSGEKLLRLAPGGPARTDGEAVPVEVLLGLYPSADEVQKLFEGAQQEGGDRNLERWEEDPSFAWSAERERGEVSFRGWRAPFVRKRAFREGGGWSDATLVDLSTPGRPFVCFALWPDETESSAVVLRELLSAVALPEPEAPR